MYPTTYGEYPALPDRPLVFESGVKVHRMHDCPYKHIFVDHPDRYRNAAIAFAPASLDDEEGDTDTPVFVTLACHMQRYRVPITSIEEGVSIAVAYVAKGRIPKNATRGY